MPIKYTSIEIQMETEKRNYNSVKATSDIKNHKKIEKYVERAKQDKQSAV